MTYMPRHRRSIITDRTGAPFDVQNNARCDSFGDKRTCFTYCPRHNATAYADHMARHATDSI
jgi:hypothetical protein